MIFFSNKKNALKSITVLFMFVFILLGTVSTFAQGMEKEVSFDAMTQLVSDVKEERSSTSNMDFVLWFMGSKQDPNSTISTEGINTKKKIMTSGLAPNRLLIKAFLKKAVNFEIALA
jgi:hypothetical protein